MNNDLERIRQSRRDYIARQRTVDAAFGRRWALDLAGYDELKAVAELEDDATLVDLLLALAPAGERALHGTPLQAPPTSVHAERVHTLFGCVPSQEAVRGFLMGAREVFHAV